MYTDMENWAEIRRRVLVDGLSQRAACRQYDVHWDTLQKILDHPEPPADPGLVVQRPVAVPDLGEREARCGMERRERGRDTLAHGVGDPVKKIGRPHGRDRI